MFKMHTTADVEAIILETEGNVLVSLLNKF